MRTLRLVSFALLGASASASQVLYVDANALGANDGSSWADAFTGLQSALAVAAAGDDVWVAQGVYTPGPTAAASDSFFLHSGVRWFGGFAGGETSVAQRDWVAHPTVLSGDVGRDDIYGSPWYSGWNIVTANSAHVVTAIGVDATAVLDGFVISGGNTGPFGTSAGSPEMFGGGVYAQSSSPTITHCVFEHNLAAFGSGAAIYNQNSSPTITLCTFRENWVHLGRGAGVCNIGTSAPVIADCRFEWNVTTTGSGGQEAQGTAISNDWVSPPMSIERCTFEHNSARQFYGSGAGFEQARGGAISAFGDGLTVKDCIFRFNDANAGGAIFVWGSTKIVDCLFAENNVYNMSIGGTTLGGYGSAIGAWLANGDDTRVVNCAIVRNNVVGGEAGAVYGGSYGNTKVRVENSILWGNTAPAGHSIRQRSYKGLVALERDCVEGLFAADPNDPTPPPAQVPGCIDANPQFVSLASLDLHLNAGSPCIDVGSNALVPGGTSTDLDGLTRVVQGASALVVDLGPYEFASSAPAACPTIVRSPVAMSAYVGANATLDVLAMGAELTYQWRKGTTWLVDDAHHSGTHTASMTILDVATSDAGSYDVIVTNPCTSLTSTAASLTVNNPPLGTVTCSGDGSGNGCPCGNDKDVGEGCENSTGNGARLVGTGSPSVSVHTALLTADQMPANKSGLFFMGQDHLGGGLGLTFHDGLLCTHAIKRFGLANTGSNGRITLADPAALAPSQIQSGQSYVFQVWYRDTNGPCNSGSNTSNAYQITFVP